MIGDHGENTIGKGGRRPLVQRKPPTVTTKLRALAFLGLLTAALAGCGAHAAVRHQTHPKRAKVHHVATPGPRLDPLTGKPSTHHGPLLAVMVENSEYARPQYGLSSADVVYEAYMEDFYYTRFMLLYWGNAPSLVGPVRSARPYFVSWVRSWSADYAHAGGSTLADEQIVAEGIHNLDALSNAQNLFFRSSLRQAPHNLFASVATLMQAADTTWGNPAVRPQWSFAKQSPGTPPYTSITLRWNTRNTIEQWRWDSAAQGWTRWVDCPICGGGYTQVMGMNSHQPVLASNIIIQYTSERLDYADPNVNDRWILINTHGQGKAILFLGHKYYVGTWSNAGSGMPTHFYLANGQPAKFDPGQTWIEVAPTSSAPTAFQMTLGSS